MTSDQHLPAFTPIAARPVQQFSNNEVPQEPEKPKRKKATAKKAAAKKPAKKAAKKAADKRPVVGITDDGNLREPAKRQRSTRVAPLMLDAAVALSALAGMGKSEVAAMQAIVQLLNPLPRPARKRVLAAVAALMGEK